MFSNAIGALLFQHAAPNFINPSRIPPLRLSTQLSTGATPTIRLNVDNRIAVCVSYVFSTESCVLEPKKVGNTDRLRKWISGILHNQEWERLEALFGLVYGQHVLYAQLTPRNALSFQTMIESPKSKLDVSCARCEKKSLSFRSHSAILFLNRCGG
jgi:hypothetical protein